jgi:hypothetical protein
MADRVLHAMLLLAYRIRARSDQGSGSDAS